MGEQQAVWERHSAQWEKIGPPLIPCPADRALMETAIMPTLAGLESPRVGLLGITLKWRIAMALSAARDYSVETARVHSTFEQLFPDRALLSEVCQWHPTVIDTIDVYKDSPTRYNVAPLEALLSVMVRWFDRIAIAYPDYEMGSHCPTLSLKRRTGQN